MPSLPEVGTSPPAVPLNPPPAGPESVAPSRRPAGRRWWNRKRYRRRRSRYHRGATPVTLLLLAAVLLGILGAGGWAADDAYSLESRLASDLGAGQQQLEAGKADLKKVASGHDAASADAARKAFAAARARFAAARRDAERDPLLRTAVRAPVARDFAAPRLQAVQHLSDMGVALSDAGAKAVEVDQVISGDGQPAPAPGQGTLRLLNALKSVGPSLDQMNADLERARKAAGSVNVAVLTGHQASLVKQALTTIDNGIQGLEETTRLIPVLLEIFGVNGPRTYLVEQFDPAELRPGGGLMGTVTVLRASQGQLSVEESLGLDNLIYATRPQKGQPGYVAPPTAFVGLLGRASWSLLDSNFYPDFPSNATTSLTFAQNLLKLHFDGAIGMDYYTVREMLRLSGPIQVPGTSLTLNADNLISETLQGQVSGTNVGRAKVLIAGITQPLLERISGLPSSSYPQLLQLLNNLAAGRHLEAWFPTAANEHEMDRIGWSGSANPTAAADFMMEVEANLAASKANYFVTRTYDVRLQVNGASLHHTVAVSIANAEPSIYPNHYSCYLRFYAAADASQMKISGLSKQAGYTDVATPPGLTMIDGWVELDGLVRGKASSATVTIDYDTPWKPDANGVGTVYWQKQGGILNDAITVTWHSGGQTYKASSDTSTDRVLQLAPAAITIIAGQPGAAHLPSLSL